MQAREQVTEPVHDPHPVIGEVIVVSGEQAQLLECLVCDLEPALIARVGAGEVGQHEAVADIGLGLARIEVGRPPHHQPRHVRHGDAVRPADGQGQCRDRSRLVEHQGRRAVLGSEAQQSLKRRLVITGRPCGEYFSVSVDQLAWCAVFPTSSSMNTSICASGLMPPPLETVRVRHPVGCLSRHPPYERALAAPVPISGPRHPASPAATPPRSSNEQGAMSHAGAAGSDPQPRSSRRSRTR